MLFGNFGAIVLAISGIPPIVIGRIRVIRDGRRIELGFDIRQIVGFALGIGRLGLERLDIAPIESIDFVFGHLHAATLP